MSDEFCYLIKRDDPYDWQIVEFSQIQKANKRNKRRATKESANEYMTISSRGITHFLDDEATFVTLDDWEREYRLYKELKKIKFFENYKVWKNFTLWRQLRRRTHFKKKKHFLESNMFMVDDNLREPLLKIRNYCYFISSELNILDLKFSEPRSLDDFRAHENAYIITQSAYIDSVISDDIKKILEKGCKIS
jgi:dynein heavy chain